MIFHMTPSGRTVLGEPPPEAAKPDRQSGRTAADPSKAFADFQEKLPEFTVTRRSALIALGIVAGLGILYYLNGRTPPRLEDRAKEVAAVFADGDLAGLKTYTSTTTIDDVVQWYGVAHPIVEDRKKLWTGRSVVVGALVIDEDRRQKSGQVMVILSPSRATSHAESIANTAETGDATRKPLEFTLFFTLDAWGKWWLDGQRTNSAAPRGVMNN